MLPPPQIYEKKVRVIIEETKITITDIVNQKKPLNHIRKSALNHPLLKIFLFISILISILIY